MKIKWTDKELTKWFGKSLWSIKGHWEKYTKNGKLIKSPYITTYNLDARKWFVENNFMLIEDK